VRQTKLRNKLISEVGGQSSGALPILNLSG
jgi:hypothetical protein